MSAGGRRRTGGAPLALGLLLSLAAGRPARGAAEEGAARRNESAPVEPAGARGEYRVGPGDVLEITVHGNEDLSRLATVQHAGEISFPLIGDLAAAGLTVAEVKERLEELLGKDYLVNPQVEVQVKEYRSQWVTLVGEVVRPGKYYLNGRQTLLDLLTEAGGFTAKASGEVLVTRLKGTFEDGSSLKHLRLTRDMAPGQQRESLSLPLESGDLVSAPHQDFCYVTGEVKNPGSFPLTSGLTVLKAVSLAGGLSKFGSKGKVEVLRKNPAGEPTSIRVNLDDIERGKVPDLPLAAEDIVKVGRRVF